MWIEVDGARAFANTGGRDFYPDLPAVVFVHGAGMDHTIWQQQTRYFAHHGRSVLAIDLPGHGRSDGEPRAAIAGLSDWLVALLDAVGAEKAAFVGHSMGALAALETAARYPARVSALALLGATPEIPVHGDLLDAAEADDQMAVDLIVSWAHGRRTHKGGNIAPGIWLMGGGGRLLERGAPGVLGIDLKACNDYADGLDAAAKVECPTLLLLGEADRMTPARNAGPLEEAIANCRKVILPEAGHMMSVEAPRETLKALHQFIEDVA